VIAAFGGGEARVIEYRVTKYDPKFRDARGAYTRDDWSSVRDIGRTFGDAVLTRREYQRVEDAYVSAALDFLREGGIGPLVVAGLENQAAHPTSLAEGTALGLDEAGEVVRRVLREEYWCRLEGEGAFIHLGWDYYMYIGVPRPSVTARGSAGQLRLFVEEFRSPYRG